MEWNSLLVFIFGALIGSFLNVCIVRLPRDESIVTPRSHCRHCNRKLPFYDLIPLVSFILLRGSCRYCHKAISREYFIVELITACMALVTLQAFGLTPQALVYFLFIAALIATTFIDLHHRIIPDSISIGGTIVGFILSFFILEITYLESLAGIATGGGTLLALAFVYYHLTKREGMGGGDIKLAAMIGAFLGYKGVFLTLFVSSILGSLLGLSMIIIKRKNLQYALPFGPFMAVAAIITLFYQDAILHLLGY